MRISILDVADGHLKLSEVFFKLKKNHKNVGVITDCTDATAARTKPEHCCLKKTPNMEAEDMCVHKRKRLCVLNYWHGSYSNQTSHLFFISFSSYHS